MATNRDVAFARRVLNSTAGLMNHAKEIRPEGDVVSVCLKRGHASNKATKIEFRPAGAGRVHVTFLKTKAAQETVISEHAGVFFDVLAKLLFDEASLLTGERAGAHVPAGSIRTTRW